MSQQQLTPGSSILVPQTLRVLITPPVQESQKASVSEVEYIGIITATKRPVYRLRYKNGEYFRFRPSPDVFRDPFAHAALNPRPQGEQCSIVDCDYCHLCARYRIDANALQTSLVPEGVSSPKWDAYFHWIMNEQIPRLHFATTGPGSKNTGHCWIRGCPCRAKNDVIAVTANHQTTASTDLLGCPCAPLRKLRQELNGTTYHFSCECPGKGEGNGNAEVFYLTQPKFPSEVCPNYNLRKMLGAPHKKSCTTCWVMSDLTKRYPGIPQGTFSAREREHNEVMYRRIAFALSPLAVDPEALSKKSWENWDHCFLLLPKEALRVFQKVRFSNLAVPSPGGRGSRWRSPSPYPGQYPRGPLGRLPHDDVGGDFTHESEPKRASTIALGSHSKNEADIKPKLIQGPKPNTLALIDPARKPLSPLDVSASTSDAPSSSASDMQNSMDCIAHSESASAEGEISRSPHDNESRHEEFVQWLNQHDTEWNVRTPKKVKLQSISLWKSFKILCGLEEDPNECKGCSHCKSSCVCQVQREDGTWISCRGSDEGQ